MYKTHSETGKALIERLDSSDVVFTVDINFEHNVYYDNAENTIHWDPYIGLQLNDGCSILSPAICLSHEMGHAAQDLDGILDRFEKNGLTPRERDFVEAGVLTLYENPISKELGESVRSGYFATLGLVKMSNPIHHTTIFKIFYVDATNRRRWHGISIEHNNKITK